MLRCRGQSLAFRSLAGVLDPSSRWGWQRVGARAVLAAGNNMAAGGRRSRSSAPTATSGNNIRGDIHGTIVPGPRTFAASGPATLSHHVENTIGPKSAELLEWQEAMLELARRHRASQNISDDPNKVSRATAEYIPEAVEAWRRLVDGDSCSRNGLWFRGAAKFYALSLGGVWPKLAHHFLTEMIELCDGGSRETASAAASAALAEAAGVGSGARNGLRTAPSGVSQAPASSAGGASAGPRSEPITISPYISQASTSPRAVAAVSAATAKEKATGASVSGDGVGGDLGLGVDPHSDGRLDWKRCLAVLKEAYLTGVELQPSLMVHLLSRVPAGNSRKISYLVSNKGSRLYGWSRASPDMLAMAALAHWREGVVMGAARHLNAVRASRKSLTPATAASLSPLVEEWLAVDARMVRAAVNAARAAVGGPAASLSAARQWPWRLVMVDIYGRAGQWAKAAHAFDTFVAEVMFPSAPPVDRTSSGVRRGKDSGARRAATAERGLSARLPLPDEVDAGGGGGGGGSAVGEGLSALPLAAWASFHPSALVHATNAYLKLGRVEEAAETLSFLKVSVRAAVGDRDRGVPNGASENPGDLRSPGPPPGGGSDPAWIEWTVRGFARVGRWDLAAEVLSPEILRWFSEETGAGRGEQPTSGGGVVGDGGRGGLEPVLESLEAFFESRLAARKPVSGQVAGATTCLELLRGKGSANASARAEGLPEPALSVQETLEMAPSKKQRGRQVEGMELPPAAAAPISPTTHSQEGTCVAREDGRVQPEPSHGAENDGANPSSISISSSSSETVDEHGRQVVLACGEALRWLSPERVAPANYDAAVPVETGGEESPTSPPLPLAREDVLSSDSSRSSSSSSEASSMLRSQCRNMPQDALFRAIRRAWVQDAKSPLYPRFKNRDSAAAAAGASDGGAKIEIRRSAAFALYEAGVDSGALPSDAHWTSKSAGVLNLDCMDYQAHHGVPLAALNLVLSDMRRKYAYEEPVERHVHPPHADLVMIASIGGSLRVLHTVKEILWLLGSGRFDGPLDGDLRLLGRHEEHNARSTTASATAAAAARAQKESGGGGGDGQQVDRWSELLRDVKNAMRKPQRGVVLCLPRRRLQGWLLREGRARIASAHDDGGGGVSGGGRDGELWKPSWVEDGIDAVPPVLPELAPSQDGTAGGVGESSGRSRRDSLGEERGHGGDSSLFSSLRE
ncbi:unnamed protein product [Scytosiphon promiscuus]